MDKKTTSNKEVEDFRSLLQRLPRATALKIADRAEVKRSTFEKFRSGHLGNLGADKYAALRAAVRKTDLAEASQG